MNNSAAGRMSAAVLTIALAMAGAARAKVVSLDIKAYTDGKDYLVIQGDEIYWRHLDFAAPGRWGGADLATILKATVDGEQGKDEYWLPTWPDPPPNQIQFPASSSALDWSPGAPVSGSIQTTLQVIQARNSLTLLQTPSAADDYTTIVDFNDDPPPRPNYYEAKVTWTTAPSTDPPPSGVPEPGTWALMLLGLGAIGLGLRSAARRRTSLGAG